MQRSVRCSVALPEAAKISRELWQADVDLSTAWPLPKDES
jgi:hypothetical protein